MVRKRNIYVALAVVIAVILTIGGVIAAQLFSKDVPGTVNIVATGSITVTPASLNLGDKNRDESFDVDITVTNNSDGPLIVSTDDSIQAELVSTSASFTLCSVDSSAISGLLSEGGAVSGNVTFTIDHDALAGDSTFTWFVYGTTEE